MNGNSDGLLSELYLAAADAIRTQLVARDEPLELSVDQVLVRREPGRMWQEHVARTSNVLHARRFLPGSPLDLSSLEDLLDQCADALTERAGASLPFWVVFSADARPLRYGGLDGASFGSEPRLWLQRAVLFPALRYHLALIRSVAHADEQSAAKFADDVVNVCTAGDLTYELTVPLAGVSLVTERLDIDDVSIRRLDPAEQGAILQQAGSYTSFVHWPDTVLQLMVSGSRTSQYRDSREVIMPLITAFALHGVGVAGQYVRQRPCPPWVADGVSYAPVTMSHREPGNTTIDEPMFQAIVGTSCALRNVQLLEPESVHDLALHRFILGTAREAGADSIVDFAIALESLLLPYDVEARHGDLGYRFRLHGACYLADDLADRQAIARQMTTLYDVRSRLVHGGKYPSKDEMEAARHSAMDLSRRCLLKAVHEGFPTAGTFKNLRLS